jgi:hypothetical protein
MSADVEEQTTDKEGHKDGLEKFGLEQHWVADDVQEVAVDQG